MVAFEFLVAVVLISIIVAWLYSSQTPVCLNGHKLVFCISKTKEYERIGWSCDVCGNQDYNEIARWHCPPCRYDICEECRTK
jgi:hypothetical protein